MARIFAGLSAKVEEDVYQAVRNLSDDFWVIFEFQARGRDVDCLILRPNPGPENTATLILTECKTISDPIWGSWGSPWNVNRAGQQETIRMSNQADANPMQQAINAGNAFGLWMKEHYTEFKNVGEVLREGQQAKAFPFLLIRTNNKTIRHTITRPQGSYGLLFHSVESWISKVENWITSKSFDLSHEEIERLVSLLDVRPYTPPAVAIAPSQTQVEASQVGGANGLVDASVPDDHSEVSDEDDTIPHTDPVPELAWLSGLQDWVLRTETRLATLEAQNSLTGKAPRVVTSVERELTPEETKAIQQAVAEIAKSGGKRDFPSVINVVNHYLGYELNNTNYNGFGKARLFFDQAVKENVIIYGELSGPAPTVYAPGEQTRSWWQMATT